jgi:paraquat-inducible protein B
MKTKVSPTIVGAFVIGAMVLSVVALFSFGGVNFFRKPQRFVVYFDESHGLDQGSQVKHGRGRGGD